MKRPRGIAFFDFDGIFIDSLPRMYEAIKLMYARFHLAPPPFAHVVQTLSAPYAEWYWTHGIPREVTKVELQTMFDEACDTSEALLFEDIIETLHALAEHGFARVIVSAGPKLAMEKTLHRHGLHERLTAIFGDSEHHKAEIIRSFCEEQRIPGAHAAFIGDRPSDIRDGKAAGVLAVGFTGPYATHSILHAAGADHVIEHLPHYVTLCHPLRRPELVLQDG